MSGHYHSGGRLSQIPGRLSVCACEFLLPACALLPHDATREGEGAKFFFHGRTLLGGDCFLGLYSRPNYPQRGVVSALVNFADCLINAGIARELGLEGGAAGHRNGFLPFAWFWLTKGRGPHLLGGAWCGGGTERRGQAR